MPTLSHLAEGDFDGAVALAADMSARLQLTPDYFSMLARISDDPDRFYAVLIARKIEVQKREPPPGFDER